MYFVNLDAYNYTLAIKKLILKIKILFILCRI